MSHFALKIQTDEVIKKKLISKSYKTSKNSLLKNFNYRNDKLVNISPKESDFPYKLNYANTETNYSSNNIHSTKKNENLKNKKESSNKKWNEIELDSPKLKMYNNPKIKRCENNINKYRIISASLLKNRKRFSLFNTESINNKKEKQIYLNALIDKSISQSFYNRIQSSRGFIRKAEAEAEKIMKNKNKKQNISFKNKHKNPIKNLDLNLHKNQYKYEYVSTEKNQNTQHKDIYYDLLMKYKMMKNQKVPKKLKNKDDIDSYLISIINNLTRKVQFLNSKNNFLSNENTMNLLNKEEYFLYQKLKEYLKNDYPIKKFSKSIFDAKNGNKYLLPLFNDINFFNSNSKEKNENESNKAEEDFKQSKYNNNDIKRKKLIELYLNNQLSKLRKDNNINNIYFPSKLDKLNIESQIQRNIKTNKSSDKINNLQRFNKKPNNNKHIIFLKSPNKNQLIQKQLYQEYKMKIIKENEDIINNYHKKINKYSSEFPSKIIKHENKTNNNFAPIKKVKRNKIEEVKSFNLDKPIKIKKTRIENPIENINTNHKKIRISYSEKKQIIQNKENSKIIKVNKSRKSQKIENEKEKENENEINNINEKPNEINENLNSNNNSKNEVEIPEEKEKEQEQEKINIMANLSTKNIDENASNPKINNKIANNEDIKNLLNKGNSVFSDFARIYKNKKLSISYN